MRVVLRHQFDKKVLINALGCTGLLLCLPAWAEPAETEALSTWAGSWAARSRLEQAGIEPFATLTTEIWGNVAGGLDTGERANALLDFGFTFDTEKLGWWEHGQFMVQCQWVRNQHNSSPFCDLTGAVNPVSASMAFDHFRVFNLYFRQVTADGKIEFKAGQLAADDDFMGSDYSGLFLNSSFGAMPSQVGNTLARCCGCSPAYPMFPVAAPGVFLAMRPTESLRLQAGLYHGQPGSDMDDNYGFDWAEQSHAGVIFFYEAALDCHWGTHAGTFRAGGTYHSGRFDNYAGINAGNPDAHDHDIYSFYAIQDLVLLNNAQGEPKLAGFVRGGISPQDDRSAVSVYADMGLNWFAPWPGRKDDVAGAAFSWMKYGDAFRQSSGPGGLAESESTLELTYRLQINRWAAVQADMQFLFNPALNSTSDARETATVLGLQAIINF